MNYRFSPITDSIKNLNTPIKCSTAFILVFASCHLHAAPPDMGSITVTSSDSSGNASGSYIAAGSGATGTFTLTRNETRGYNGNVVIRSGTKGIELQNDSEKDIHKDRFKYTFTITPNDNTSIHTIKIGQASYTTNGNSEVARHTLSNITQNKTINIPSRIYVKNNPPVPFYYDAMGDYFMGSRESGTNIFRYNVDTSEAQVRSNSTNNLYFYKINELAGSNSGGDRRYEPSTIGNEVRFANSSSRGILPESPTFANILKSTSTNSSTFTKLKDNQTIIGNSYVTYGVENRNSNYVVAVSNVTSITLTYDAIMNGSNAFPGNVIGETFNEWISFGVESEFYNYEFKGTAYNDNGNINDQFAKDNPDTIDGIYNNAQYFNGTFDSNESGITGSTVSLASNCNSLNPNIIATQTITEADAGAYNFTVPISTINTSSSICIIEDNNSGYPIRTTSAKQPISFNENQYLYEDINFGRVIAANKALVLEKEQAANDCTISTLPPSSQNNLSYSRDELEGVDPGQCIAYRITATNRANLPINEFVMQDKLQEAGVDNATVSSVLTFPVYNTNEYAEDSVAIGNNDVPVKTRALRIAPRGKKVFYFNTKYGTTTTP